MGDLVGDVVAFNWQHLQVAPLGIVQWSEKRVQARYRVYYTGSCGGCGSAAGPDYPVWAAPEGSQHRGMTYCPSCWNGFFMEELEYWKLTNTPSGVFDTDSTAASDSTLRDVDM